MKTYYAQVGDHFVNYLFRKDYTYIRLKDTTRFLDTIIYTEDQIKVVELLHPDLIKLCYGKATRETNSIHRLRIDEVESWHLRKILKHINN